MVTLLEHEKTLSNASLWEWTDQKPETIISLTGDASTRSYFRVLLSNGESVVLSIQSNSDEYAAVVEIQRFLKTLGLPVPRFFYSVPHCCTIVQQDLGDDLLENVVGNEGESALEPLYHQAVNILLAMRKATDDIHEGCRAFGLAFDLEKLLWEMDFFMTHFVKGLYKLDPQEPGSALLKEFFFTICSLLASEPRVFTHRDYHSRNLILYRGRLKMIDFQDARMGPSQYDLASLLRDSYVTLPDSLVDKFVEIYAQESGDLQYGSLDRFRFVFDVMSLQRNIKALGTFGYQLTVRKAERYCSAIPRTISYIARNMERHSELKKFKSVVEDWVCGPELSVALSTAATR